jgi:hypothetical protein
MTDVRSASNSLGDLAAIPLEQILMHVNGGAAP